MIFFDIETTSLNADSGMLNCVGLILPSGEMKFIFADKLEDEKKIIEETLKILRENKNEKIVIWYSPFDFSFFVTRALKNNVDASFIYSLQIVDPCKLVQQNLKLSSNKLEDVSKFFSIEKNLILGGKDVNFLYNQALQGNAEAKQKIIDHCRDDLQAMKKVFEKLNPYMEIWLNNRNTKFKY